MDKNAIKKYAVWARTELITRVSQRAEKYDITAEADANASSVNGVLLSDAEKKQRKALIEQVNQKGFDQVMEEVAYTWFNRFIALRFMEVNGYLPSHIRVFTDDDNSFKPQILTEAIHLELDGLDMEKVYEMKTANENDALYKYLIITQCNDLSKILPGMFQKIADYTELLFPDNILREGSVVEQLVAEIPENDWKDQVQIVGWLYQYYNSEPKDKVFRDLKKKVKITKESIPAATQLFTPDWIVRYMVENSLGKLWLDGHHNTDLKNEWKYYLDDVEQSADVKTKLDAISAESMSLKPEDIRCIDPCSGSGHILAYMFDVLIQIYMDYGIQIRDAVRSIIQNNIWGLDIDNRAAQLAYFSVMMKGVQYDRRFLNRKDQNGECDVPQPHIFSICESNNIDRNAIDFFCNNDNELKKNVDILISELHDAKEYGSIIKMAKVDFGIIYDRINKISNEISIYKDYICDYFCQLVKCAEALSQKYNVVITNPPYMGKMPAKMTDYVVEKYPDSKYDLYSVFIEKCADFADKNGFVAMVTQHTWMFISSFERMRETLLSYNWKSICHLGTRAFEAISGEVVQTVAFVYEKCKINAYKSKGVRLVEYDNSDTKEEKFLSHENEYEFCTDNFEKLPGEPYVYWLSDEYYEPFDNSKTIENYVERKAGVVTGNDPYFVRFWFEPNYRDISFEETTPYSKYHIMQKGGGFRRYYGNYEYVIRLADLYIPEKTNVSVRRGDSDYYFKKAIGWSQVGNAGKSFREIENSVCGTATPTVYLKDDKLYEYILAFLNSKIAYEYLTAYNPTINLLTTDICNIPLIVNDQICDKVTELTKQNMDMARTDWNSYETSWDFCKHPLINGECSIEKAYKKWELESEKRYLDFKKNEEELNKLFIDLYGLSDKLAPEIDNITVRKADLKREIKSFISYAVGCMFGRYSLDKDGIIYAGGEWNSDFYKTYQPDQDGIIPICDDEYFKDDIVERFVEFVEKVYGENNLEENLSFIAKVLEGTGAPREIIRNYFLNSFYSDHCKTYQKCPIYWQFDSGKKNGFRCLIYIHRYKEDTVARIRTDYVHEMQARYRTAIEENNNKTLSLSGSDRVRINKKLKQLQEQADEIHKYEEKIHHLADQMISIDLDDGVKKNYEILKDVLAKIK